MLYKNYDNIYNKLGGILLNNDEFYNDNTKIPNNDNHTDINLIENKIYDIINKNIDFNDYINNNENKFEEINEIIKSITVKQFIKLSKFNQLYILGLTNNILTFDKLDIYIKSIQDNMKLNGGNYNIQIGGIRDDHRLKDLMIPINESYDDENYKKNVIDPYMNEIKRILQIDDRYINKNIQDNNEMKTSTLAIYWYIINLFTNKLNLTLEKIISLTQNEFITYLNKVLKDNIDIKTNYFFWFNRKYYTITYRIIMIFTDRFIRAINVHATNAISQKMDFKTFIENIKDNIRQTYNTYQIINIPQDQIMCLYPYQIKNLTDEQLQALTSEQIKYLLSEQLQALSQHQLSTLLPEQIKAIHINSIATINNISFIHNIPENVIKSFTEKQIQSFTEFIINHLTYEQFTYFTPEQLMYFTDDQLKLFADKGCCNFIYKKFNILPNDFIKKLSFNAFRAMNFENVDGYYPSIEKINQLTNEQIQQLPNQKSSKFNIEPLYSLIKRIIHLKDDLYKDDITEIDTRIIQNIPLNRIVNNNTNKCMISPDEFLPINKDILNIFTNKQLSQIINYLPIQVIKLIDYTKFKNIIKNVSLIEKFNEEQLNMLLKIYQINDIKYYITINDENKNIIDVFKDYIKQKQNERMNIQEPLNKYLEETNKKLVSLQQENIQINNEINNVKQSQSILSQIQNNLPDNIINLNNMNIIQQPTIYKLDVPIDQIIR